MIELEDLSFSYGDRTALDSISLSIEAGESVALLGPNGSGKSTLMRVLNGLAVARTGSYRFDGKRVDEKSMARPAFAKELHRRVGFLFQNSEAQLFCPTVEEELAFAPRSLGLDEAEVARRVADSAALLGIGGFLDRTPYRLSEGEKRKVALAAVLSAAPDVLVLDEPLNALDPRTKRFLRDLLLALNAAGKTIVASIHEFSYLEGVFRRAVVLGADHRLARDGDYKKIAADTAFLEGNNLL